MKLFFEISILVLGIVFIWNLVGIFIDDRKSKKDGEPKEPSAVQFIEGIFGEGERRK